jgi:methionine-rich copper-binding protein CopC
MDAGGDFVVTWQSAEQDGSAYGVYAQRYNAAGVPQGTEFRANTHTASHQRISSAAMDADGDFVLVWNSYYQDGFFSSIYARRYDVSTRPAVTASQFVWQSAPQRIEFTFDQDVSASLSTADLVLRNLTTSTTIPSSSIVMNWNAATRTATFRFPTLPNGGSLPDGRYRATLAAAGVSNAAGTTIAVDYALDFFVLAGDANRDARVNLQDFNILAANFGQSGRDFSRGDFNYDMIVNLADFNILAARFGSVSAGASSAGSGAAEATVGSGRITDEDLLQELLG